MMVWNETKTRPHHGSNFSHKLPLLCVDKTDMASILSLFVHQYLYIIISYVLNIKKTNVTIIICLAFFLPEGEIEFQRWFIHSPNEWRTSHSDSEWIHSDQLKTNEYIYSKLIIIHLYRQSISRDKIFHIATINMPLECVSLSQSYLCFVSS